VIVVVVLHRERHSGSGRGGDQRVVNTAEVFQSVSGLAGACGSQHIAGLGTR